MGIRSRPSKRIAEADRKGERLGADAYGYSRAFCLHARPTDERSGCASSARASGVESPIVLDPTAGGGSIPFEAMRLGLQTFANDLNPVAALDSARDGRVASAAWLPAARRVRTAGGGVRRLGVSERLRRLFPCRAGRQTASRRLPLGAHDHLPVLRRSDSALAELATRARWHRRPPAPRLHCASAATSRSSRTPRTTAKAPSPAATRSVRIRAAVASSTATR